MLKIIFVIVRSI